MTLCNNMVALMECVGHIYDPNDCRFFIDAPKASLKSVLLHNGNEMSSVPSAYTNLAKELTKF